MQRRHPLAPCLLQIAEALETGRGSSIAGTAGKIRDLAQPWQGRAAPDLRCRCQLVALVHGADADADLLCLRALAGGADRRAAFRAEELPPSLAVVRNLDRAARSGAGQPERLAGGPWRSRERRCRPAAGQLLAVGAMADRHPPRVDLCLAGDMAAIAAPVDFHPCARLFVVASSAILPLAPGDGNLGRLETGPARRGWSKAPMSPVAAPPRPRQRRQGSAPGPAAWPCAAHMSRR